jgi:aminopeptidase-like protein
MSISKRLQEPSVGFQQLGHKMWELAASLYPLCRSITGQGTRQTLIEIQKQVPIKIREVPTGTNAFDWTVPNEWNIRDAYIKDSNGKRIVDFGVNNLHVVNYSEPVRGKFRFEELKSHLHSIPDRPDWIPYRTTYYQKYWGFCLTHNQLLSMVDAEYEVLIDSSLEAGSLSFGELLIRGELPDEVLISCHICHPSLANDNLSGLSVAVHLAKILSDCKLRYSYRFLFIPGTIGAITWLSLNRDRVDRVKHGLVLSGVGDAGGFHYKKSRQGCSEIDRAMQLALRDCGEKYEVLDFSPYGYDERQYCSPGFNLPVGCLMRSVWGSFPEYHTSADNLDFIKPESLANTLRLCCDVFEILETNGKYQNLFPFCEPQMGKRNLYRTTGGGSIGNEISARLWVLNFSDGLHSLLDIAERSGIPYCAILSAAKLLKDNGLLVSL